MKKRLRIQRSGYAIGFLLLLSGLVALLLTLWKTWPAVSSAENPISIFWESLWTGKFSLFQGIEFNLVYLAVIGVTMVASGAIVFALSREWFLLVGTKALFRCPFCRKKWNTSSDKALVHCPYCRQLVHPKPVEK